MARLMFVATLLAGMRVASADDSASDCPAAAEVTARLAQLLVGGTATGSAATIVLRDHGARWEIEVAGQRASYADPLRDCSERARVATVFAVLALEPPDRETTEVVPLAEAPRAPPSPMRQRLELAPELVLGLRAGDTAATWGGVLRWHLSGMRLGLTAGVNAMMPATMRAGAYEASLARMVFDVSPRVWLRAGMAWLTLELGPFIGWLFAQGRNLSPDSSSTNVEAGARLAMRVELASRRLSPFLGAQGELSLRRYRMSVEPSGDVGSTPRVWLALLLGASFGR